MDADRHNITLRERIEALPEDSVLFRTDFPEYHSEFVGGTLAELTQEQHRSKENYSILHDTKKDSEIDRKAFDNERENHWKSRAEGEN